MEYTGEMKDRLGTNKRAHKERYGIAPILRRARRPEKRERDSRAQPGRRER
jgi:hypothetical protein